MLDTTETTPDPESFNITDWLTPEGDRSKRARQTVDLTRDLTLGAEIKALQDERRALEAKSATEGHGDEAVGEAGAATELADLEAREAALLERIQAAKMTVTVVATILSEIETATRGINPKTQETLYTHAVLAECVEFPDGSRATRDQWAQLHNTLGDGQVRRLFTTWAALTNTAPVVTAPFSHGPDPPPRRPRPRPPRHIGPVPAATLRLGRRGRGMDGEGPPPHPRPHPLPTLPLPRLWAHAGGVRCWRMGGHHPHLRPLCGCGEVEEREPQPGPRDRGQRATRRHRASRHPRIRPTLVAREVRHHLNL